MTEEDWEKWEEEQDRKQKKHLKNIDVRAIVKKHIRGMTLAERMRFFKLLMGDASLAFKEDDQEEERN